MDKPTPVVVSAMQNSQPMFDVIIVGGGHNGLVAASYLSKAKKSVLLLEGHDELGGATTSVRAFPDYDANLSRYSYLVSLLPDQIVQDLGLDFRTLPRSVDSYTPYSRGGMHDGLLVSRSWDSATESSFHALTGSSHEAVAWKNFYSEIADLAARLAPSMLKPLRTASRLKSEIGLPETWRYMIEEPIGEVIRDRFRDDLVRGVSMTDALIGTFVSVDDLQANRCFLYHLIGNGDGQWRVPKGGMETLVKELRRVAEANGVTIRLRSKVTCLETGSNGVAVETQEGKRYAARHLLFAGAPQHLARLRGIKEPESLEGAQLKINMLLTRLPMLKSGIAPDLAFSGTLHINESHSQLETAYREASHLKIPEVLPLEAYCHTLADRSILSAELASKGYQTLTVFALHTPAKLFDENPERTRELVTQRALSGLNEYLVEPIESLLAPCSDGSLAIEAKSPLDLEKDLALPRGNIFHRDLSFPFIEDEIENSDLPVWGAETDDPHLFLAGAGAKRGGGVSGIAGHNAAMAVLAKQ